MDAGGVQQLLQVPRSKHTFAGLSFAFFGLSAIPLAFERVVSAGARGSFALGTPVAHDIRINTIYLMDRAALRLSQQEPHVRRLLS